MGQRMRVGRVDAPVAMGFGAVLRALGGIALGLGCWEPAAAQEPTPVPQEPTAPFRVEIRLAADPEQAGPRAWSEVREHLLGPLLQRTQSQASQSQAAQLQPTQPVSDARPSPWQELRITVTGSLQEPASWDLQARPAGDPPHSEGEATEPYLTAMVHCAGGSTPPWQAVGHCLWDGFSRWRFDGAAGPTALARQLPHLLGLGAGERSLRLTTLLALRGGPEAAWSGSQQGVWPHGIALACGDVTSWPRPQSDIVLARSPGGLLLPCALLLRMGLDAGTTDPWLVRAQAGRGSLRNQAALQISTAASGDRSKQLEAMLLQPETRAAAWVATALGDGSGRHPSSSPSAQPIAQQVAAAGGSMGLDPREGILLWILLTTLAGTIWRLWAGRRHPAPYPNP